MILKMYMIHLKGFALEAKAFLQHFPKCCDISMTHRLDYKSLKYDLCRGSTE